MTSLKRHSLFVRDQSGQSLIEIAITMPVLLLMLAYAVDFGYFFIVAASITSAAGNAAEYSVQGYLSAAQKTLPSAGPASSTDSVSATAFSALASLVDSSNASIQVCSKATGVSGNLAQCSLSGTSGTSYTPSADPEAPKFIMHRVDITYTVQPPIPLSFFSVPLLPSLTFHRQVSMRALD